MWRTDQKHLGLWGFIHVGIPEQSWKVFISPSFPGNTAGAVESRELGMDIEILFADGK